MRTDEQVQVEEATAPETERAFVRRMGDEALYRLRWVVWGGRFAAYWLTTTVTGQAVGLWLATRVLYGVITIIGLLFQVTNGQPTGAPPNGYTLDDYARAWMQFDGPVYQRLALHDGYAVALGRYVVYMPLYPGLIHLTIGVVGTAHVAVAALLVSNVAALAACVVVAQLARQELGTLAASRQAVRVQLAYPLAFFLAAPYTEGLFIAFAGLALLCARRGWWYRAALCAWLATETRVNGVALALPLLIEFSRTVRAPGWSWATNRFEWRLWLRRGALPAVALAAATPLALALQALICVLVTGHSPITGVQMESTWGHQLLWPWDELRIVVGGFLASPLGSYEQVRALIDLVPVVLCTVVTMRAARRGWWAASFVAYVAGLLVLAVASPIPGVAFDPLVSAGRYLLPALPVTFMLALWTRRRRWLDTLLVTGGFALQAVLLVYWLHGGWIV